MVVMITCSSKQEAGGIKKVLLEAKKVACVNIISKIDSFFWWRGKIDTAKEVLLLAKTKESLFREIIALVKKIHKYEVPEIVALPIIAGNKEYLEWIDESVR